MAKVVIDVAAEFTGKQAFDKANKSTINLEKSVKRLGRSLGIALSTTAIVNFGKASVKAFAADDGAAKSLGQTLKNLGLAYGANTGTVNGFISRLEAQTGVLDDELRPAMDRLLRATGDVAKSQELLNLSLDIAAGTGKSVTQVSQSLQKAYLGQNQALGRLGVGLSKVELTSSSFEEIQIRLNELFAGQAVQAADSFQGSLNKLSVAANNAKETIGKGIIEALSGFSGKEGVGGAVSVIDKLANGISDTITGVGYLAQKVDYAKPILVGAGIAIMAAWAPWFTAITAAVAVVGYIGNKLKKNAGFQGMGNVAMTGGSNQDFQKADAAAKLKADKAIANNKIKLDKKAAADALKLKKAGSNFDLEKIGLAAALKGKISEEEKTRLLLLQAIANDDAKKAEDLAKKLKEIQDRNIEIAKTLAGISETSNPFAAWGISLTETLAKLRELPPVIDAAGNATARGKNNIPGEPLLSAYDGSNAADLAAAATLAADLAAQAAMDATSEALSSQTITDAIAAAALAGGFLFGGSSSMFNPNATTPGSSAGAGIINNMVDITVNIDGMIDLDNFGDVFNQAMLNAIRKGLPQSIAGQLP